MRILGWTLSYWHNAEMARAKAIELSDWKRTIETVFSPFDLFIASGTWSDPEACPVSGATVVNAGLEFNHPYEGHRYHYGICAFTAAMAFACGRRDWDLLVVLDTETLIGDVNINTILKDFWNSDAIVLSPEYFGFMGGPMMAWKRAGALRLLHNRKVSNLRDEDQPQREMLWEHECWEIYRPGQWMNPWPKINCMLGLERQPDHEAPIRENWPFLGKPLARTIEPYKAACSPKTIPWQP